MCGSTSRILARRIRLLTTEAVAKVSIFPYKSTRLSFAAQSTHVGELALMDRCDDRKNVIIIVCLDFQTMCASMCEQKDCAANETAPLQTLSSHLPN